MHVCQFQIVALSPNRIATVPCIIRYGRLPSQISQGHKVRIGEQNQCRDTNSWREPVFDNGPFMLQNARRPGSQHSGGCRTDELNTERSAQSRAANTDILLSRCRKTLELLSSPVCLHVSVGRRVQAIAQYPTSLLPRTPELTWTHSTMALACSER